MNDAIHSLLQKAMPEAQIELEGDGCHFKVIIHSDELASMPRIAQHRKVYQAIGDDVGRSIHALSIEVHPSIQS